MRVTLLLAALAPLCAQAKELQCMPDKICIPGTCDVPITDTAAFRVTHPDSAAPVLHSHGEAIPMTKTFQHRDHSQWKGVNAAGEHEDLILDLERMRFIHSIGGEFVQYKGQTLRYRSVGQCEVR